MAVKQQAMAPRLSPRFCLAPCREFLTQARSSAPAQLTSLMVMYADCNIEKYQFPLEYMCNCWQDDLFDTARQ